MGRCLAWGPGLFRYYYTSLSCVEERMSRGRFWECYLLLLLFDQAGTAKAAYTLRDNYDNSNFFNEFTFFSDPDPTNGFVNYAAPTAANLSALAGYDNKAVYLGVDYITKNPSGSGRGSVRVQSQKTYTRGLFVADIAHMPASICGSWPAFWTVGDNWPSNGEIDIIEGVNDQTTDSVTLHTSPGCKVETTGTRSTSKLSNPDCNSNNAFNGCGFSTKDTTNYGSGFNSVGGGVYAMEWTSSSIRVFFFPRSSIPSDITAGRPQPDAKTWGEPIAAFSGDGCDFDEHFNQHRIVFDTTFCGDWAGSVWSQGACGKKAATCEQFVAENPKAFGEAYWSINSVKVYQQ